MNKNRKRYDIKKIQKPGSSLFYENWQGIRRQCSNAGSALDGLVPMEYRQDIDPFSANKDIGFVNVELSVTVKIEAFPFTKHGILNATLKHISYDAVADEENGVLFTIRVTQE